MSNSTRCDVCDRVCNTGIFRPARVRHKWYSMSGLATDRYDICYRCWTEMVEILKFKLESDGGTRCNECGRAGPVDLQLTELEEIE